MSSPDCPTTVQQTGRRGRQEAGQCSHLPEDGEFVPGLQAYFATATRPQNRPFVELLLGNGLQQPDGIETDLGTTIGKLRQIA